MCLGELGEFSEVFQLFFVQYVVNNFASFAQFADNNFASFA